MTQKNVEVLVCTKCRRGLPLEEGETRPGQQLFDNLTAQGVPDGVTLKSVECLSNCSQGCSMVLRGSGKWTYVYGNLHETSHTDAIIDGVTKYQATQDGVVPWRERPDHFRKNCIARIPPLEIPNA